MDGNSKTRIFLGDVIVYILIMDINPQLEDLLKRWKVGAKIYKNNLEEARAKNLDHQCILGCWSSMVECCSDLEKLINDLRKG